MAIYIEIEKVKDVNDSVEYKFGLLNDNYGVLTINKTSGEVIMLEPMESDKKKNHFARAAHKVKQHWKEGKLPNKTCWAS